MLKKFNELSTEAFETSVKNSLENEGYPPSNDSLLSIDSFFKLFILRFRFKVFHFELQNTNIYCYPIISYFMKANSLCTEFSLRKRRE